VGKVPALLSLGVTFGLLLGGVLLSLFKTRDSQEKDAGHSSIETGEATDSQAVKPGQTSSAEEKKDPHLRV